MYGATQMKPYGREKMYKNPSKQDHRINPKKMWVNWWEQVCGLLTRGRMKHDWKQQVKKDLHE